ncbi:GNAT family N-acetyltransferase [Nonomuraea glycinis]|uniref:N-acetyltransferase n=1 Tax=Nonomuraea glycinis TaxID=2047744 RepID=A0A918A6X7_9ACTN|nr:GNAT family N-acetyltransferase [Nonomuraea glycinis]MCA2178068.1 GNAT family N-acetyltransferase [Nonomuraea glycinis]GGP06149.1 N-acetyltransferase [Nonomuraea glycinis]
MHTIERLPAEDFPGCVKGLAEVLTDAVDDGASVGFLTPFDREAAAVWWRERAPAVADGSLIVWVCRDAGGIVATVSLALPGKPNSRHRAEVSKLLVHRDARGRGLARALLATVEAAAVEAGVSLLVLDTRTGSAAERLYLTGGWTLFGVVPGYAADPDGSLQDCSFFYKPIA